MSREEKERAINSPRKNMYAVFGQSDMGKTQSGASVVVIPSKRGHPSISGNFLEVKPAGPCCCELRGKIFCYVNELLHLHDFVPASESF